MLINGALSDSMQCDADYSAMERGCVAGKVNNHNHDLCLSLGDRHQTVLKDIPRPLRSLHNGEYDCMPLFGGELRLRHPDCTPK